MEPRKSKSEGVINPAALGRLLIERGFAQRDIAERLGLSQPTISKVLRGKRILIAAKWAGRVGAALGVKPAAVTMEVR